MRINSLLNEIIRGTWMLDTNYVLGAGEIVSRIIAGERNVVAQKQFDQHGRPVEAGVFDIYNPDGSRNEKGSRGEISKGSTARIMMTGPIIKYGDYCTWGSDEITNFLYRADRNPNIDKIVLYIDSPGGSVNAIAPFIEFGSKIQTSIDVVVDQCCSLGYWTACCFKDAKIYVDNTVSATVGSIGVQLSFMDAIPHYESQGYKWHRITPEESSEKNAIFDEVLAGNYDNIKKEMLSPLAIKFQDAVKAARPNLQLTSGENDNDIEGVLKGKTFYYEDALRIGLIDGVMSFDQLLQNKKLKSQIEESRRETAIHYKS